VKIEVDYAKCQGLGICEGLAPDVFEVDENGDLILLMDQIDARSQVDVEAAVECCPMEALRLIQA
jgi:ferredoxin